MKKIKNLSITIKIIGIVASLITIIMATSFTYLLDRQKNIDIDKKKHQLLNTSQTVLSGMEYPMLSGEMDMVEALVKSQVEMNVLTGIRLISLSNEILISNNEEEIGEKIGNASLDEAKELKRGSYLPTDGSMIYYSPLLSEENCLECHDGAQGDLLGVFEMTTSTDDINNQHAQNRLVYFFISLAVLLVIVVGVYSTLKYTVIKPIRFIKDSLQDIAQGEGDLTTRIETKSEDEIGRLGYWFNVFIEKLHSIIAEVVGNTEQLDRKSVV